MEVLLLEAILPIVNLKIMVKEQKSESYLIDENQKLINKFELHSLLNKNNKKQS